ncbi:hypothetical protein GCM10009104_26600 [Marinobacterium maritimum]|uniref:Uncharacterized protein n=1 Tax=Marinobacterium maritimum TaxID=500162 RepID=A0ABN1I8I9_9GAMM
MNPGTIVTRTARRFRPLLADIDYINQARELTGRSRVRIVGQNLTINDSGKSYVATGGLSRVKQGCSYAPEANV